MSTGIEHTMRIGEVADLTGTTPRTIRYYEEIGLLVAADGRQTGKHRCYSPVDVERIREIVRLKELLGLSLDELAQVLEAEAARASARRELRETDDPARQRELVRSALGHLDTQLALVRRRIAELTSLELELNARVRRGLDRLAALDTAAQRTNPEADTAAAAAAGAQDAGAHSGA